MSSLFIKLVTAVVSQVHPIPQSTFQSGQIRSQPRLTV